MSLHMSPKPKPQSMTRIQHPLAIPLHDGDIEYSCGRGYIADILPNELFPELGLCFLDLRCHILDS